MRLASGLVALLALGACVSAGPRHMSADRADYAQHLRESEKSQLLTNIVAMRYGDAPLFLTVTSVVNQYSRQLEAGIDQKDPTGLVTLRETPTVTYTPMSGERFAHSLLTPLPPASLLGMIEAGWASDLLFRMTIRSVNGVSNASLAPLFEQPADPRFLAAVGALRDLQRSGGLSIKMMEKDKVYSAIGRLAPDLSPGQRADIDLLRRDLGLGFSGQEMRLVFSGGPLAEGEVAVTTRSMFQILQEMSRCVDVSGAGAFPADGLLKVRSGRTRPSEAYASASYRGRWFWIGVDDEESQRMFLLAQVLMSLSDDTSSTRAPLLTLPAG